jgi:hypothetical protein
MAIPAGLIDETAKSALKRKMIAIVNALLASDPL